MYLIRLDDASDYMNHDNWEKIEKLLDKYNVKPIVGIIPDNKDVELLKHPNKSSFWEHARIWQKKGWTIAMHGYEHKYLTENSGINPVNHRSEFAGIVFQEQKQKIRNGYNILKKKGLFPTVFFAPSHTFDDNTLLALKEETDIKIISDTIANDEYYEDGLYFVPQQSGTVRLLPFKLVTFCYHPNNMSDESFNKLEHFLCRYRKKFIDFKDVKLKKRKLNMYDRLLRKMYFMLRK